MKDQFTLSERRKLIDRIFQIFIKNDVTSAELEKDEISNGTKEELKKEVEAQSKELYELVQIYTDKTPVPAISRCPFTGDILKHSIDTFGLDGVWWNSDSPIRPIENLPKTYFAMSGALKIAGEIEKAPFICEPGPDVPFVVPRLLEYNQVKAVVSCIKVGVHTAYPIFYYADPMLQGIERLNEWGTEAYQFLDENNQFRLIRTPEYGYEFDFNLENWIRNGKLLWIFPDDASMTLHSDVERCPYLNLEGDRQIKYIQNGEMWRQKTYTKDDEKDDEHSINYDITAEEIFNIFENMNKEEVLDNE